MLLGFAFASTHFADNRRPSCGDGLSAFGSGGADYTSETIRTRQPGPCGPAVTSTARATREGLKPESAGYLRHDESWGGSGDAGTSRSRKGLAASMSQSRIRWSSATGGLGPAAAMSASVSSTAQART